MNRYIRSSLTLLLFVLPGCYSYTLVQPRDAPVGSAVRARVTAAEAERLGMVLRREDRVLEGQLVGTPADGLLIRVPSVVSSQAGSVQRLDQRVTIPGAEIVELEVRRLDPWKTAGVVAIIGAAVGYAAVEAFGDPGDPNAGDGKGGTDKLVIPLGWVW